MDGGARNRIEKICWSLILMQCHDSGDDNSCLCHEIATLIVSAFDRLDAESAQRAHPNPSCRFR